MVGRSSGRSPGPSAAHAFVLPRDPRSGLAVAGVHAGLQQAPTLALAEASLREARCALKGCGKLRADPIHEPDA